jgi:cytochrome c
LNVCYHALMKSRVVVAALASTLTLVASAPLVAEGDAANGRIIFNQNCASCHAISAEPVRGARGPNLLGVIGRNAGSVAGWEFSPALRASGLEFHPRNKPFLVWTEENLDKWLADPAAFVPGSRMDLKMPDPRERRDVIAYIRIFKDAR